MARIAISMALLLTGLTTHAAHAQSEDVDPEVVALADAQGLDPTDLAGAVNTLKDAGYEHIDARSYLIAEGELAQPPPAPAAPAIPSVCGWPICGPLGQRLYCIEQHESQHSGTAVNPYSGAAGWLQWLRTTAASWGVVVGNRASEWNAASRIAAKGDQFFWSQWRADQGYCR